LGHQLVSNRGILHPIANLALHELGEFGIGRFVDEHILVIAEPDTESRAIIELVPKGFAFLFRHFEHLSRVSLVHKAAGGCPAARKDFVVALLDRCHFRRLYWAISEWRAPIGASLKNGQARDLVSDGRDQLDTGRPRTDDRDALTAIIDTFARIVIGMEGLPFEGLQASITRRSRR